MSGQQTPVDLNTPMTINLPLGAWNTVLGLIAKGPWEISDPLMQVMRAQLQQGQQQRPAPTPRLQPVPEVTNIRPEVG
jgi:hypothetical protein